MGSKILSILEDGTNQKERRIDSLSPRFIKPDDRDIPDLLNFIFELCGQFNYYNFSDTIDGDWRDLLKSDPNILIILISRLNVRHYSKKYEKLKLLINRSTSEKEALFYFNDLIEMVGDIALFLEELLKKATDLYYHYNVIKDLKEILNSCQNEIEKLKYCNLYAKRLFDHTFRMRAEFAMGNLSASQALTEEDIFGISPDKTNRVLKGISYIDEILSVLKSKVSHLTGIAEYYLKDTDLLQHQFNPHIGLLITFLKLYSHLQNQLDGFTTKHLNFYYHDILGIKPKPSYPDSAYILFESNAATRPVQLPHGTSLLAKTEDRANPAIYALQGNQTVDNAQIKELKTIFVADRELFAEDNENNRLTSLQIYSGDYPVISPSVFSGKNNLEESWPILGEDQSELAKNERTMEAAATGVIIGSPLLYLPGGERFIQLTFTMEETSIENFNKFIRLFSEKTGGSIESAKAELLSDAFRIDFTTPEGWESVKYSTIKVSKGRDLIVQLSLSHQEKALDINEAIYRKKSDQTPLPLIRLLINNQAAHNAYSLFKDLLIDQLTIRVSVKGFQEIKMQNNIGALSPGNPFQIFGPQPSVGSYLSIKNTNIFNKFTKDFMIRLEWLDLPKSPGGFKTYYTGYNSGIENDSFQIKISSLSNGLFIPDPENQQKFRLFNTKKSVEGSEILQDTTLIGGIDLKKMGFPNEMSLKGERESETQFKDGTVKISLDAPPEAFGHKLFPQIFPKVLQHNSKRLNKALPIPEQPFIPVTKAISIDYTLEYTETWKGNLTDLGHRDYVHLIHQYPFGYDKIYPGKEQHEYPFMPVFNFPSNLYIGIKDLKPGSELSLLFILEEKNFKNTNHPNLIHWSYLHQRDWTPITSDSLLQDTTNNFLNTGIIRLKIPYLISKGNNAMLNPNLYWLRASTYYKSEIKSRVNAIFAHAAKATRVIEQDQESDNIICLPPGSIRSFVKRIPEIQNIWQPLPSFGGKEAEGESIYRTRVSERLRHKQRPVSTRDIEQFVLDKFPDLLMVKCLRQQGEEKASPKGNDLQIILIPREQTGGQFKNNEPKVSLATINQVKQTLLPLLSPFIRFEVNNPVYERIKIACKVKFAEKADLDRGLYIQQLNTDIRKYICAWLYEATDTFRIGTTLYLTDMYNFLKSLKYISFITGFSMIHFFRDRDSQTGEYKSALIDTAVDKVKFIRGSVPDAVLIPDTNHLITFLPDIKIEEPSITGIGDLPIGSELLISEPDKSPKEKSNKLNEPEPEEHFRFIINQH